MSENINLYNQYASKLSHIDQGGRIVAEYIWLDGSGIKLRAKCRSLDHKITKLADIPEWNYDGSSTDQAVTENSEVILKPVAYFADPFRGGDNVLVLCESWNWKEGSNFQELVPANTNFRYYANKIWNDPKVAAEETWYGIE